MSEEKSVGIQERLRGHFRDTYIGGKKNRWQIHRMIKTKQYNGYACG